MLGDIFGAISDFLGDTLSSVLEAILNATIFKLCYHIERLFCWIIGLLTELFEVFSGLEPATYDGQEEYLINIFFSNKAVTNIYWGMAVIGFILIIAFAMWSVIKKMFDLDGKQQQSMGQIIWSALRSMFLIAGMTLIMNVVLYSTGILMQQIDYIFNNAYHLDQPQVRTFSEEEYASMGRALATVGNYSMVPNSNNRYNLNTCFNDIRSELYFLQQQGVFEYSYYDPDSDTESWQSLLAKIAKSADLRRDVVVDRYNEGIANSITEVMKYLQNNKNVRPLQSVSASYTATEKAHLDRLIFLMGTMRAARNGAFNEKPAFDDALRGPYYYAEGRDIYDFDQVNSDFNIGFPTDYILVWLAAVAVIVDLVIIILNCIARIFNMLFLYIIAPPVIAAGPLDGGGKFKQWTTAFLVQSLSVFGTVIAMRLLLIYLPIVCSPQLVLVESPMLNAVGKFMLVYGGIEASKKSTGLLTGILADSAGWQSVQAGDMSSSASRMVGTAAGIARGAIGTAGKMAGGVLGFAAKPLTNRIKQPFQRMAEKWSKLGTGGRQERERKAIADEISKNKAVEKYKNEHPEDAPYLSGGRQPSPKSDQPEKKQDNKNENNKNNNQNFTPPPLRQRQSADVGSTGNASLDKLRASKGFDNPDTGKGAPMEELPKKQKDDSTLANTRNRPTLDPEPRPRPPAQNRNGNGPGPQGGPEGGRRRAGSMAAPTGNRGNRNNGGNHEARPRANSVGGPQQRQGNQPPQRDGNPPPQQNGNGLPVNQRDGGGEQQGQGNRQGQDNQRDNGNQEGPPQGPDRNQVNNQQQGNNQLPQMANRLDDDLADNASLDQARARRGFDNPNTGNGAPMEELPKKQNDDSTLASTRNRPNLNGPGPRGGNPRPPAGNGNGDVPQRQGNHLPHNQGGEQPGQGRQPGQGNQEVPPQRPEGNHGNDNRQGNDHLPQMENRQNAGEAPGGGPGGNENLNNANNANNPNNANPVNNNLNNANNLNNNRENNRELPNNQNNRDNNRELPSNQNNRDNNANNNPINANNNPINANNRNAPPRPTVADIRRQAGFDEPPPSVNTNSRRNNGPQGVGTGNLGPRGQQGQNGPTYRNNNRPPRGGNRGNNGNLPDNQGNRNK